MLLRVYARRAESATLLQELRLRQSATPARCCLRYADIDATPAERLICRQCHALFVYGHFFHFHVYAIISAYYTPCFCRLSLSYLVFLPSPLIVTLPIFDSRFTPLQLAYYRHIRHADISLACRCRATLLACCYAYAVGIAMTIATIFPGMPNDISEGSRLHTTFHAH